MSLPRSNPFLCDSGNETAGFVEDAEVAEESAVLGELFFEDLGVQAEFRVGEEGRLVVVRIGGVEVLGGAAVD